ENSTEQVARAFCNWLLPRIWAQFLDSDAPGTRRHPPQPAEPGYGIVTVIEPSDRRGEMGQ
ncbi:MAG TPA: hypothetical protein VGI44_10510, partial [Acidimicrobiales bacterium]